MITADDHMVDNLLASLDTEDAALHSYDNFHAGGVTYINLLRTERLTAKLYLFDKAQHNSMGYLVWPHNHGYNFYHRTLVGTVTNYKFKTFEGKDWTLYTYSTPLNGGPGLGRVMPTGLRRSEEYPHGPGSSYYLTQDEIHTISVTERAAAVLIQYHDLQPGCPTVMFAPSGELVSCGGRNRYEKMNEARVRNAIHKFKRWMKET